MGSVCSGGTKEKNTKLEEKTKSGFSGKLKSIKSIGKQKSNLHSHSDTNGVGADKAQQRRDPVGDSESRFSRELEPHRASTSRSSFLGRAGTVGLERAVNVLDSVGSSVSILNSGSGFVTGVASRGNKISILSFEVANTIAKGANFLLSLSEENIQFLRNDVLNSEAVHKLVSTNMKELLSIAAADKRDELDVFSREVIRFGDLCKDPQWHNLGRYFSKLDMDNSLPKQTRADADQTMKELTSLAQHTSELYHELNALDRFEQDYSRRLGNMESNLPKIGDGIMPFQSELKQQKKLVRNLKKKSLWSRSLEEIVEKLVDIVTYMHQAISEAFGESASVGKETTENPQAVGVAGLALHYANLINQIDNIAARPASLPHNVRDTLYHGLPPAVKKGLRSRILSIDTKGEHSMSGVKDEMEKTLQWLVPVATNTTKAHQGFGWVGEWANTSIEYGRNTAPYVTITRLQTLHHADKQKTDECILELVAWLHHLIRLIKQRDNGVQAHPQWSPTSKGLDFHSKMQRILSLNSGTKAELSEEEVNLLNKAATRRSNPSISRSQELPSGKSKGIIRVWASRSAGNSPERSFRERNTSKLSHTNILDILDGLSQAT